MELPTRFTVSGSAATSVASVTSSTSVTSSSVGSSASVSMITSATIAAGSGWWKWSYRKYPPVPTPPTAVTVTTPAMIACVLVSPWMAAAIPLAFVPIPWTNSIKLILVFLLIIFLLYYLYKLCKYVNLLFFSEEDMPHSALSHTLAVECRYKTFLRSIPFLDESILDPDLYRIIHKLFILFLCDPAI